MRKTVRIGVLSDTHLTLDDPRLPALIEESRKAFIGCELVLHAGDVIDPQILHLFPQPLLAVRGNLDPPEFPERRIVEVGGMRIGLIHGWGAKYDIEERILRAFSSEKVDCIVYGHSHQPVCHFVNEILLFNPGSPTDRRQAPFHSFGLLTIDKGITGEIMALSETSRD